jgi:peptidoglycan/LPS O-acetylase OafA/YrhL
VASARNLGLDVVRSLAILLVLVAHYSLFIGRWTGITPPPRLLAVGGIGVEMFFVLSGFLIGRLLLEIAGSQPTFRQLLIFLTRRWMRTLPLYYLWLLVLLLAMPPAGFLTHAAEYATLSQNLFWPMPADNWFGVSWSLTIEEWFYVLFGSLAVASAAVLRSRNAVWVAIAVFLAVPPILRWMVPDGVDMGTGLRGVVVYRLDAIAWGVVVADLTARNSVLVRHKLPLLCAGLALIAALWGNVINLPPHLFRTFLYDLMPIGFALCLPAAALLRNAGRWFAAVARTLSAQSYALYLMHLSVLQALDIRFYSRHLFGLPLALALAVALPFGLAWLSYRFFESPILALRPRQDFRRAVASDPIPVALSTGG